VAATSSRAKRSIRSTLAAACAVVGVGGGAARATEVESAVMLYSEPQRVTALETVLSAEHDFGSGRLGRFKLVFDALTGASANGAAPWTSVQTFTRPSGAGRYRTDAGDTPLDDTFRDSRTAVSAGYAFDLGRLTHVSTGLYGSGEHDYFSLGLNASVARDFDRRNRTLSFGLSYSDDTVSPEGGRPVPFASMADPGDTQPRLDGDGSKQVTDAVLGLTQVIDRATLVQLNYGYSRVDGYQTDPYKLLSVVDATGLPTDYVYESRPDARTKHIFHGRLKRHLAHDVIDLGYRFMTDDWGVVSHTLETRYRLDLGGERFLEPHVRWYRQSAADFYARWLDAGAALPANATADYRLGEFRAWTFGLKHGRRIGEDHRLTARIEYYRQFGDGSPPGAPGALADLDLFPSVEAWIVQLGYSFGI
jgi:hypothetical protein